MESHNTLYPDAAMHVGDVVTSVNGVRGDWNAMVAEFAKASVVFKVERSSHSAFAQSSRPRAALSTVSIGALAFEDDALPKRWSVDLQKRAGERFGARVVRNADYADMETLQVKRIYPDGILARHNASSPQPAIEVHDLFVSVNGV